MWFHEFGIYSGAVLPVGLAWVWTRRAALTDRRALIVGATRRSRRVMLVLALGRYVGLAGLLVHLPVIGAMRAPARYVVLMQFALAILAVIAVEDLLAIGDGRREPPAGRPVLPWLPTAARRGHDRGPERRACCRSARHTAATVAGAAPGVALVGARHAAGDPGGAPRALGAAGAGRGHGRRSRALRHRLRLPRAGAVDSPADGGGAAGTRRAPRTATPPRRTPAPTSRTCSCCAAIA